MNSGLFGHFPVISMAKKCQVATKNELDVKITKEKDILWPLIDIKSIDKILEFPSIDLPKRTQ